MRIMLLIQENVPVLYRKRSDDFEKKEDTEILLLVSGFDSNPGFYPDPGNVYLCILCIGNDCYSCI